MPEKSVAGDHGGRVRAACASQRARTQLRPTLDRLKEKGIVISLFIDPEELLRSPRQRNWGPILSSCIPEPLPTASARNGDRTATPHCGCATGPCAGLRVNAGHGINYENIGDILRMPAPVELNIGHSIISRAISTGLDSAVREMLRLMNPCGPLTAEFHVVDFQQYLASELERIEAGPGCCVVCVFPESAQGADVV